MQKEMSNLEDWTIEELTGYKVRTTFYIDFSIAEKFGTKGIKSTYEESFEEWNKEYEYVTELCMVLNWKMFRWFSVNDEFYELYRKLYTQLDQWCVNNLKGEELDYYCVTTN